MSTSKIEWTGKTWNPTTGCDKVSPGCKHCYADRMAKRLQAMGQEKYRNGFQLTAHTSELNRPHTWAKPTLVFVNSMSDLFHKDVPDDFIKRVFKVMEQTPQHTYQVLTKRSERLAQLASQLQWPDNVWMGVSVENDKYLSRIDDLRKTSAQTKFLSLEPLLGPLSNLDLTGIDWVIVGGESGPGARSMKKAWVRDLR
ncbi:MAG: hypothetical protein CV087_22320, partial [Candidatus Brocadia sp. WS118]